MQRLNYANGLYVIQKPLINTNSIYYEFRVLRGNHCSLVKRILKTRWW